MDSASAETTATAAGLSSSCCFSAAVAAETTAADADNTRAGSFLHGKKRGLSNGSPFFCCISFHSINRSLSSVTVFRLFCWFCCSSVCRRIPGPFRFPALFFWDRINLFHKRRFHPVSVFHFQSPYFIFSPFSAGTPPSPHRETAALHCRFFIIWQKKTEVHEKGFFTCRG